MRRRGTVVAVLGTAQTLSWASSYYLPAVLAGPMAHDLGVGAPTIYAAFSGALAGAAVVGPWAGRAIDRGRPVLAVTNLVFAAALLLLGLAPTPAAMVAAWLLMGLAMGSGLYEAAFATLVRLYRHESRNPITGITLIAGFASTVGWPLSAWMETRFGWRGACFGWAALHLLLGLPLNLWLARSAPAQPALPAAPAGPPAAPPVDAAAPPAPTGLFVLLAFVFATTMFVSTAMAAHLPALLQAAGASLAAAVAAGALVGPAQVAGRLLEFGVLRRMHPLLAARLSALGHPLGAFALLAAGPVAAPLFALLHGAGNGILTIAKGTLPLALFGAHAYGERQGWLMMPARIAQALAPFVFGLAIAAWGAQALWLSAGLGLAAFAGLLALRHRAPPAVATPAARGT